MRQASRWLSLAALVGWAMLPGPAAAQLWPEVPDERSGVVATETSGYGGPVTPMQGGVFLDELGLKWWYDYDPESGADVFAGYHKLYMYWRATTSRSAAQIQADAAAAAAAYPGQTIWWAMSNEPNDLGQANQPAAGYAAIYYHYHSNLKAGDPTCRILGPGILNWDFVSSSVYQRGKDWYEAFRQAWYDNPTYRAYSEANYGVSYPPQDGFNLHAYDLRGVQGTPWAAEDWRYCRDQIQMCYDDVPTYPEVLTKRIWLTEFAALRSGSMAENIVLTRQLVGWMRQQAFMERWFWFTIHSDQYWSDSTPPRLELLDETGQRTAAGSVARELATLPVEVVVDPVNGHYAADPTVTYVRPGTTTTSLIRDAGGGHPRFELVQNTTLTANTMRGRTMTAGPGRIIRKVVFQFSTNYDNSKVRLIVDRIHADGTPTEMWSSDQYGANTGSQEITLTVADRARSLGVGLLVVAPFYYSNPTGEWFGEMPNPVLYTEPAPLAADRDLDGDVDLNDFGHFQACLTGTGQPPARGCLDGDLDGDGDADGEDLGLFIGCLTAPGLAADADCLP